MLKILPIIALVLVTGGFIIWKIFWGNQATPLTLPGNFSVNIPFSKEASSSASSSDTIESRVKELEFQVTDLLGKAKDQGISGSSSSDPQIKSLQKSIDDLKTRVTKLEGGSSSTTTTSTSKSPAYISLAASGSNSDGDWTTISGTVVTIDTGDYSGYTSMQFEANIQIFQQGTAYARISNKTDGTSILNSEISTSSTSYTNITSSKFTLPSGKKDYQLQLKSLTTGYAASVQNARIKVNF